MDSSEPNTNQKKDKKGKKKQEEMKQSELEAAT